MAKSKQELMTRGPRTRGKVSQFHQQTQLPQVTQPHPQQKAVKEKKKRLSKEHSHHKKKQSLDSHNSDNSEKSNNSDSGSKESGEHKSESASHSDPESHSESIAKKKSRKKRKKSHKLQKQHRKEKSAKKKEKKRVTEVVNDDEKAVKKKRKRRYKDGGGDDLFGGHVGDVQGIMRVTGGAGEGVSDNRSGEEALCVLTEADVKTIEEKSAFVTECPGCHSTIRTNIQHDVESDSFAVIAALSICCLCFIPFLFKDCQTVSHYCPECHQKISKSKPFC
ncbi:unnamed protein product [Dimorphilus gyrociliatus]|uniref:LITAF domain-containing protein n=1 Tax=Dimorphilus gyrociliatus TaxID=2664684 RepID=A0A7I8VNG4_9ANNE|nr:unnamed protein product [Dimorphilus gyrociliatus]